MSVWRQLAPWMGIAAAAIGWALAHQIGSEAAFDDCRVGDTALILLTGFGGLAVALLGGFCSLAVRQRGSEGEGRRFVGLIGALLAALASFAIVLQSASVLILPACAT